MHLSYDIEVIQGSTLLLNINLKDTNDNYIDLNGYSVRGYVRSNYSSSGILLNLQPQVHPSFISGLITLSGSQDDTATMPCGTWVYDIECSGSDNYVFKPLRGYFLVEPESTR